MRIKTEPKHYFDINMQMQIMEDQLSLKRAQKELDERLKKRILRKSHLQVEKDSESYQILYNRLKQSPSQTERIFGEFPPAEDCRTTEEGITFYTEINDRPALKEFMRRKIEERKEKEDAENNRLKTSTDIEISFLSLLSKRKQNKQSRLVTKIPERWEKDLYDTSIENIQKISARLKKMYTRVPEKKLEEEEEEELENSSLWRKQEEILAGCRQMSKEGRDKLGRKFVEIIKEVAKSLPSKKDRQFKTMFNESQLRQTHMASPFKSEYLLTNRSKLHSERETLTSQRTKTPAMARLPMHSVSRSINLEKREKHNRANHADFSQSVCRSRNKKLPRFVFPPKNS